MKRARDPSIAPRVAKLLRYIAAVEAEGERTVVFRFSRVYAEQLYDATFHTAMLPAHLLAALPPRQPGAVGLRVAPGRQRPVPVGATAFRAS